MNFCIIPKHAPATPTLSQFQTFAARSGIDVRVDAPAVRRIDGRSVLYTGVAIRCAVGDAGWRAVAPNVHALQGADHDGFVGRLAGSLAWLRFFDLAALPRDGALHPRQWDEISTLAVADHLAAMLDIPSPDPSTLDDLLASWRACGLKGVVRHLLPPPIASREAAAGMANNARNISRMPNRKEPPMNQISSKSLPVAPQVLRAAAEAIAVDAAAGFSKIDLSYVIRLGRQYVTAQAGMILTLNAKRGIASWRLAPPVVLRPLRKNAFSPLTLDEINYRLAAVLGIDVLVGYSQKPGVVQDAIRVAMAMQDAFQSVDPLVAEIDFLTWRDLGCDLSAWFDVRFASSRMLAA